MVHTINMNIQRITISVPVNVYQLLTQQIDTGNISRYISETIHGRLVEEKMNQKLKKNPVEEFLVLRKHTVKISTKKILNAIHKGRQGYP